jgi:hypothetical protein
MNTQIFVTGLSSIPKKLKQENSFQTHLVENPYDLREALNAYEGQKIIVAYLPFLEQRHFELYSFFQKNYSHTQTFLIVKELSAQMKIRLKSEKNLIVLWKTEEAHLSDNIKTYLEGRQLELREEKRLHSETRAMVSPSLLPLGSENRDFQPILGGAFHNISQQGSCLKIKAPFYQAKDFINITYQNKEGEFVSLEGQVRWMKWNEREQQQEMGIHFVSSTIT